MPRPSAVGNYAIFPVLLDPNNRLGNYAFIGNNGMLTITASALSVTVTDAKRPYAAANPAFTGTIVGIQNNIAITGIYACAATSANAVGTYPIQVFLFDPNGRIGNYTVTQTNGTLTITPVTLTVAAANATRLYNAADPVFTGSIDGILGNDVITAMYSTSATGQRYAKTQSGR